MILRCGCCGMPFARLEGGRLIVVSAHHGQSHTSSVAVAELALAGQTGAAVEVTSIPRRLRWSD